MTQPDGQTLCRTLDSLVCCRSVFANLAQHHAGRDVDRDRHGAERESAVFAGATIDALGVVSGVRRPGCRGIGRGSTVRAEKWVMRYSQIPAIEKGFVVTSFSRATL
jgi:hypothetical protein